MNADCGSEPLSREEAQVEFDACAVRMTAFLARYNATADETVNVEREIAVELEKISGQAFSAALPVLENIATLTERRSVLQRKLVDQEQEQLALISQQAEVWVRAKGAFEVKGYEAGLLHFIRTQQRNLTADQVKRLLACLSGQDLN